MYAVQGIVDSRLETELAENIDTQLQDRMRPTGEMVVDARESVAAPEDMLTVERYREAAANLRQQEKLRDKAQAEIRTMNNAGVRDPDKLRMCMAVTTPTVKC